MITASTVPHIPMLNRQKDPIEAYKVNAEAVNHLAKACKNHDVSLVHISTDYVFDGTKNNPYTVDDLTNPI